MSFATTLGTWIIPLAITLGLSICALIPRETDRRSGDWDFTFWIPAAFRLVAAVIGSLLVWLVWSLAR